MYEPQQSNWLDPSIRTGPTRMNRDPPLAAYGVEQSELLAAFLADQSNTSPYPTPELVFSSPFYRCVQTALPTLQALGLHEQDEERDVQREELAGSFSPVKEGTGLHPRPGSASSLAQHFPANSLDETYSSTVYASRLGETIHGVHDRADLFVEAFVGRMEELYPDVRSVVIFSHAAAVIALGRALTGDRSLNVIAGTTTTSLYKRKTASPTATSSNSSAGGVGEWDILWNGRADYLPNGVERDWSFRDAVINKSNGEVIHDNGDGEKPGESRYPEGLVEGGERWLRRGRPPFEGVGGVLLETTPKEETRSRM
ncbi:hypothetical protein I316_00842 [Kwoniella heveanensis BCC8398]|uniref:Phosphoglycerate mutase n=1 Tax=Kwoniella heveanensis BCC8398 TaxID=1296120 RepID=A0A1B9H373_9TREE|nr:hypothetical protein I316_00842 [Kwoniella heveanensis BCC8398]